jgi:hypothetical protein
MPRAVHYHFTQRFAFSARKAYDWCTDFDPGDHVLMGEENAERKISRPSDSTIILTDTFQVDGKRVEKQKLVQLYPHQLFWTATHLSGPAKFSQFLYKITSEGDEASRLDFTGLFLDYANESMKNAEVKALADQLCEEDAWGWKLLAKAMAKDLCT